MSDEPEWFAPKRYGFGATPISWQGWALTLGFVAVMILIVAEFGREPVRLVALLVPLVVVFMFICARTTRGGWRWRWGDED
jgi:di/tricarboxylate transporter